MVALALGILIPVVIIFIRENMNTKIRGRKDLESLSLPLIGEIPLSVSHDGKSRGLLKRIFTTNNTRQKKGQRTALQLFTVNWNRGAKSKIEEAPRLVVKDGRRDVRERSFSGIAHQSGIYRTTRPTVEYHCRNFVQPW